MNLNNPPQNLQVFLPSSNVADLDIARDKNYIIEKLIHRADFSAWRWMNATYDAREIAEVVKSSRDLDERDVRIWQYYLDIPEDQILCLQPTSVQTRKKYWM